MFLGGCIFQYDGVWFGMRWALKMDDYLELLMHPDEMLNLSVMAYGSDERWCMRKIVECGDN